MGGDQRGNDRREVGALPIDTCSHLSPIPESTPGQPVRTRTGPARHPSLESRHPRSRALLGVTVRQSDCGSQDLIEAFMCGDTLTEITQADLGKPLRRRVWPIRVTDPEF